MSAITASYPTMQLPLVATLTLNCFAVRIAYFFEKAPTMKASKEKWERERPAREKAAKEKAARQKAAEQKKAREKAEKAAVAAKMKLPLNEIVSDLFTFRKHFVNLQIIF